LELVQFRPLNASGVFLNESLVFHFSENLDPTSVLSPVVEITARDEAHTRARGELHLSGNKLVFVPAPVLRADLSDGGYLPNTTYDVELGGFPRLDGLRGQDGAPLHHSVHLEFRTVDPSDPQSGYVFEDSSLDVGMPVFLRSREIEPGEPILLEGEEPLHPGTLFAEDFLLRRRRPDVGAEHDGPRLSDPIPLRARLIDNRNRRAGREGTTLIELQPLERLDPGVTYYLYVDPDLRLRDFGGHRVLVGDGSVPRRRMEIEVLRHALGAPGSYFEYTETFIDAELRSPEPPEPPADSDISIPLGVDGTLSWGTSGRLELRWPAAAGRGTDGFVELSGRERRRDVQSTRLRLAAGERCALDPAPGPVILRAQGKLLIEGALLRTTNAAPDPGAASFLPVLAAPGTSPPGEPVAADVMPSLSDWLREAVERNTNCVVLIAGGDLVIPGRLEVDCPVLLVAGGRLRVTGRDLQAPRLATLGEGGGTSLNYGWVGGERFADVAGLELDAPTEDLLAVPLMFGVRSSSIPRLGEAQRWHAASPRKGTHPGSFGPAGAFPPRLRVQFLGEPADPEHAAGELLVDDPVLLVDCPTLRLAITLEVGPGEVWDPPWVDSVQVRWD